MQERHMDSVVFQPSVTNPHLKSPVQETLSFINEEIDGHENILSDFFECESSNQINVKEEKIFHAMDKFG